MKRLLNSPPRLRHATPAPFALTVYALAAALVLLGSCKSGVVDSGTDTIIGGGDATSGDGGSSSGDSSAKLPDKPGDPCPHGKCANKMLCFGGVCHARCDQPNAACNDKQSPCKDNQACLPATSFDDACYPATGKENGKCGSGVLCPGGMSCINLGNNDRRCLKLCKYGCGGKKCITTTKNCKVCSPN